MGISEYIRNEAQIIEARKNYREGHTQPSFVAAYGTAKDMRAVMHRKNTYDKHEMIYVMSTAAACNNLAVAKCLVEEFHMPVRSEDGTRALDAALCNLNPVVAEYLISKGADTSRYRSSDKLSEPNPTAVSMCLVPIDYHMADHLRTAMGRKATATTDVIREIEDKQRRTLRILVKKCGMDVNRLLGFSSCEETPLMRAMFCTFEHVELLMSLGADPRIVTPNGESVFRMEITVSTFKDRYNQNIARFKDKYGQ